MDKIRLAFKITDCCNFHCDPCPTADLRGNHNLFDIKLMAKYIAEFRKLDCAENDNITLHGGEVTAPYMFGNYDYFPKCVNLILQNNMVPFIQTNALWGSDNNLRPIILTDLTNCSARYSNKKYPMLNIPLGKTYENAYSVARIISSVNIDMIFNYNIRLCLFATETIERFTELLSDIALRLCKYGLRVAVDGSDTIIVKGNMGVETEIWVHRETPKAEIRNLPGCIWHNENYLEIDTHDNATLNNKFRTKINNRPLNTVVSELMARAK